MELEQPFSSMVSSPSPAHRPTASHRLIGPVVLLKDILHSVLTAVREHHDHLVAVGTCDVGLWGRHSTCGHTWSQQCWAQGWMQPRGLAPTHHFSQPISLGARVARQEGHCQLGNDVVANATRHLTAPFIFILPLAQCLFGSGPSTQPC